MIRQYAWLLAGNYAPYGQNSTGRMEAPEFLRLDDVGNRMHIDHCIESIRQTLMCHGDVTPLLTIDDPDTPLGHKADFNIHQKCRIFCKLKNWVQENFAVPP